MATVTHYVKGRKVGSKRFGFVTRTGLNYLRIYAIRFPTELAARAAAATLRVDNPEVEFIVRKAV